MKIPVVMIITGFSFRRPTALATALCLAALVLCACHSYARKEPAGTPVAGSTPLSTNAPLTRARQRAYEKTIDRLAIVSKIAQSPESYLNKHVQMSCKVTGRLSASQVFADCVDRPGATRYAFVIEHVYRLNTGESFRAWGHVERRFHLYVEGADEVYPAVYADYVITR